MDSFLSNLHALLRWGECKAYANCYMDGGYGDGEMFAVFILIMFSFCVFFSDEVLLKLTYICVIFVIDFFCRALC